jgi:pyridoxamine 5'-phosphate oxidase
MSILSWLRALATLGRGVLRGLSEETAGPDPIALFGKWFDAARRSGVYLSEAMALATATSDGIPSARMMLLKGFDARGFRFFTNYESRKAEELTENASAAIVFHWARLHRQVRIEGTVEKLGEEESAAYFRTRPRGSQLGAWASRQSSVLASRRQLDQQFDDAEARYRGREVPLPAFWGGYRLVPRRIEFWQGRANRLHDRLLYEREGSGWRVSRLSP